MVLKIFYKFRVWENLLVAEKCVLRFFPCNGMSVGLNYSLIQSAQFSVFRQLYSQTDTESKESLRKWCEILSC